MQPLAQMIRTARANMTPVRQRTQYSCVPTSLAMCLNALGHNCSEDEVNTVMGARPMKGATWEQVLATAQHYGCRATLTMPSTVWQLKEWTDRGVPVMIAWNPEGREWSHASAVFHVDDDGNVHVADPNIPDPDELVRVVPKGEFYKKWYEKWPNYLVRRPACAIEREITPEGRQVMASVKVASNQRKEHMVTSELTRQWGSTLRTARRDMKLLAEHRKKWDDTKAKFDKELVKGLKSLKGIEADDNVGQVMTNIGPLFGIRYLSLSFSTAGSTVPAEKFLPFFSVSYFPSISGARDWPFLPIKAIERDLRSVVQKILSNKFKAFGRVKQFAGGSAAPGRGAYVEIPEELLENAWKNIPLIGKALGKAIADLLGMYQKTYKEQKDSKIEELERQVKNLENAVDMRRGIVKEIEKDGPDSDSDYVIRMLRIEERELESAKEQLEGLKKMAGVRGFPTNLNFGTHEMYNKALKRLQRWRDLVSLYLTPHGDWNVYLDIEPDEWTARDLYRDLARAGLSWTGHGQKFVTAKKKKDNKVRPWRNPDSAARARGEGSKGGPHQNRSRDVEKGRNRKPKHKNKQDWKQHLSSNWDGNR